MERKTTDDNTPAPAGKPLNLLDVLAEVPDGGRRAIWHASRHARL